MPFNAMQLDMSSESTGVGSYLSSHFILWAVAVSLAIGCTSFRGEYSDPSAVEVVDDSWNETDNRTTAVAVVKKMLDQPWHKSFQQKKGERPIVIVAGINNRTDEHIDTQALVGFVSDELINSGRVRFVDQANRDAILKEIDYQTSSGRVKASAARKKGQQIGAHFLLSGDISSHVQSRDGLKTITYQTQVRLTDLESSEIVWSHKELIKKRFRTSKFGL